MPKPPTPRVCRISNWPKRVPGGRAFSSSTRGGGLRGDLSSACSDMMAPSVLQSGLEQQAAALVRGHIGLVQVLGAVLAPRVERGLVGVVRVTEAAALAPRVDAQRLPGRGEVDDAAGRGPVKHRPGRRADARG